MKSKHLKIFTSILVIISMMYCSISTYVLADTVSCEHELELDLGISPTCTEPGIDVHYDCIKCGKMFMDANGETEVPDVVLPATDHDWDSIYTSFGESGHAFKCCYCDEYTLIEEHMYGEGSSCMECGFAKPKPLTKLEKKVLNAHIDIINKEGAREIVKYVKKNKIPSDVILVTAKDIVSQKSEEVKESDYLKLSAKMTNASKNEITIKWNPVEEVDGYIIFGSQCSGNFKELGFIDKESTSFTHSNLKKGTYYKYVVVAYNFVEDVNLYVSISKTVHAATSGGSVGNVKAVKVNKSKITLNKGNSFTLKATAIKENKRIATHRKVSFESSNIKIATVSSKGIVKAKKKGKCNIYAYAQNGIAKKIKVTVK